MGPGPPPLKIVFINPTGILGGAELCLLDLLESLRQARPGWRLGVVLGEDGPLRESLTKLDFPCTLVPLPRNVARLGDAGLGLGLGRRGGQGRGAAAGLAGAGGGGDDRGVSGSAETMAPR